MRFKVDNPNLVGALLWISSLQYFIIQLIVISAWTVPHSWANNFISDLGNTECGNYAGLAVCSPLHPLMNLSFVIFGITMAVGSVYLQRAFASTTFSRSAFILMMLSGIGTVMVGLFPENTISSLHVVGAFLGLGIGNLSILLLGLSLNRIHPAVRTYTIVSAMISLGAFALFSFDVFLGLGRGGMERLISYPFTIWMVTFGFYTLLSHSRDRLKR